MSNATDIRQSGGTAKSVDHTDTGLAVSRTIPVPPTDTLYRAALTFCLDGADVMMYATLKGAETPNPSGMRWRNPTQASHLKSVARRCHVLTACSWTASLDGAARRRRTRCAPSAMHWPAGITA